VNSGLSYLITTVEKLLQGILALGQFH
jgi:hypothetical protein